MKTNTQLRSALFILALGCSISVIQAQGVDDYIVDQFDDGAGATIGSWSHDYGPLAETFEFDATEDRGGGANPGAMKVTAPFDLATYGGDNQSTLQRLLNDTLDLSKYTTLHFSIKVDTNSSRLSDWGNGAFGNIRPYIRNDAWADASVSEPSDQWIGPEAYGNWVDVSMPINQLIDPSVLTAVNRLGGQIWSGWGTAEMPIGHTNTVVYWLDNIWFEWNTNTAPPASPTLTIDSGVDPGLNLIASGTGQYDRQSIRTVGTGYGFYNAPTPTTYSFTVAKYASYNYEKTNYNFQTHIFLVPNAPGAGTAAPDWNEPNVIWPNLQLQTNGTWTFSFQYKTNQANGNSMYFNDVPTNGPVGTLAEITNITTVEGTYSVTFENNTNVTISTPGSSTSFVFPLDSAALFNAPINAYFGSQPNEFANRGMGIVLSQISISGANGSPDITDTFSGSSLDTNNWEVAASDPPGIVVIPSDAAFWINWTLPDVGFAPQQSDSIPGAWNNSAGSPVRFGDSRRLLVTQGDLPGTDQGYFRLIKRQFAKLQILMPGESPAPGTPSGKTGTPDPQDTINTFFVTVRAVDDNWNLIPGITHTVTFSSSDGFAFLPSDGPLANGQGSFEMLFGTSGPQTVTVSDVTDSSKLPDTSSEVTVN